MLALTHDAAQWSPFKFTFGLLTIPAITAAVPDGYLQQHLLHLGGQRSFNSLSQSVQGLVEGQELNTLGSGVLMLVRQVVQSNRRILSFKHSKFSFATKHIPHVSYICSFSHLCTSFFVFCLISSYDDSNWRLETIHRHEKKIGHYRPSLTIQVGYIFHIWDILW